MSYWSLALDFDQTHFFFSSEEDEYAFDEKKADRSSPYHSHHSGAAKRGRSSSLEDSISANKKRKADNPKKKQSGTLSETIVPKKPKNLFMMQNCYEFDNSNYSSSTTTKDENEPELEALESSSKDLLRQPKRSSQPHVS